MARRSGNLRWLVSVAAVVLAVLWVKNGGLAGERRASARWASS